MYIPYDSRKHPQIPPRTLRLLGSAISKNFPISPLASTSGRSCPRAANRPPSPPTAAGGLAGAGAGEAGSAG